MQLYLPALALPTQPCLEPLPWALLPLTFCEICRSMSKDRVALKLVGTWLSISRTMLDAV